MSCVRDVMGNELVCLDPDDSVEEAIEQMLEKGLSSIPVVDESCRLLGLISEFDLLDLLWDTDLRRDKKVYEYMSRKVRSVSPEMHINRVIELMRINSLRIMPVMQEGQLVGLISRRDILRHTLATRQQGYTEDWSLPLMESTLCDTIALVEMTN